MVVLRSGGVGLVLWGALLCGGAQPAHASEGSPVLVGDALVRPAGSDTFASSSSGAQVDVGTAVRAPSGDAVALKVTEGVSVRLAPDSAITVRSTSRLPAERPGAPPPRALQLSFASGELDLDVHEKDSSLGIVLLLPGGRSLAVWHGTANVSIHGDNVAIALYEGMAITGSASKWKPLVAGSGCLLDTRAEAVSRQTPATPSWQDGAAATAAGTTPFALVRGDQQAVVGGSWSPAAGAATYRVEVARDPSMLGPVTIIEASATTFKSAPLPPGAYVARVRALSSEGLASRASALFPLRVARMTLPELAMTTDEGAIVLPAKAVVTLDDPRDLEVATISELNPNAPARWVPAEKEISLMGGARRGIRLRYAPSQVETKLLLVRRDLKARVAFSPANARWPETPVDVTVKVEDLSGYLDPAREPITMDVRVGLDPVPLTWSHTGDSWTARVAPHTGSGPWVLRVNVADRAGVPIGASLLDIDGPLVQRASYGERNASELGLAP